MSRHSKVIAQTDTHTQYENITFPHTRAVKIQLETKLQTKAVERKARGLHLYN